MTAYQGTFQPRRGTAATWQSNNTVLALAEWGYDSDADRFKIGDGVTAWKSLGWATDPPLVPPPSTGWTALNSGSITDNTESRVITLASSTGANWKGELRTLSPASNYTATFYFEWGAGNTSNNSHGILLKNSGGNSLVNFGPMLLSGTRYLSSQKWTSVTAYSGDYLILTATTLTNGTPNWLRVRDDTTTRFLEYSYNGVDWVLFHSVGRTDFITPNQIGWGSDSEVAGYTTITRLRHFVTS